MGGEMAHLHVLADEIGPRPATTDAEAHAADYIEAVFAARGLEVERQDFESPRTYSWTYVIYNVLTVAAAVCSGVVSWLYWPSVGAALLVAVLFWLDLDTRWGLSALMPKGPSQHIIARQVPKIRRGERTRRVVVISHYDSARASLAFSPAMVRQFNLSFGLMKACTLAVPVMLLARAIPVTEAAEPWLWYSTIAVSAYLLVPIVINVHREFFMRSVDGANDNASGIAALLGVMEAVVPEPEPGSVPTTVSRLHGAEAAAEAEVISDETLLVYTPTEAPESETPGLPEDFSWADSHAQLPRGQGMLEFDTIEFDAVDVGQSEAPEDLDGVDGRPRVASGASPETPQERARRKQRTRSMGSSDSGLGGWLGLADDFDARREGRKIGSWDNFDDEDDGFGFKGGWAGDDPIEDPDFASNEAARIRRRVTESTDRALQEKEVWFVATGAEEVGSVGMRAFLSEYKEDLKDAVIINLDNVGAGALYWVTAEGMARRYRSDRRLIALAKRVSRENNLLVRPRVYKGLATDATVALAHGYRAISVMAFDANGRIPNWHWHTDTSDYVSPELIELATTFVTAMIREA